MKLRYQKSTRLLHLNAPQSVYRAHKGQRNMNLYFMVWTILY